MTEFLLSILFGIIEGVTEFLPVSSTAHLRVAQALFHLDLTDGYWKMYSVVIQLGAILSLPLYFAHGLRSSCPPIQGGNAATGAFSLTPSG